LGLKKPEMTTPYRSKALYMLGSGGRI